MTQVSPYETGEVDDSRILISERHFSKLKRLVDGLCHPDQMLDSTFAVCLTGPSGSGKSTLIRSLKHYLDDRSDCVFVEGECFGELSEILEPILQAVRNLVSIALERQDREEWRRIWRRILDRHASVLNPLLPEIDWGESVPSLPALTPLLERSRLVDHLVGLFLEVAKISPVILYLRTADELDEIATEFIETAARVRRFRRDESKGANWPRFLVLFDTRESRAPVRLPESELVQIPIRGFGRDELTAYLERELGGEIPLSIREKIFQLTRGIPADLAFRIQRGRAKGWPAGPVERAKWLLSPFKFDAEVRTILKQISPDSRRILEALAFAQKPISPGLLSRVSGLQIDGTAIESELADLLDKGLLRSYRRGAYAIRFQQIEHAIQNSLTREQSREWHRKWAEAIRTHYQDRELFRYQEVYFHDSAGEDRERSIASGFEAADAALGLYGFSTAGRIYRRLLHQLLASETKRFHEGVAALTDVMSNSSEYDLNVLDEVERAVSKRSRELESEQEAGLWRRLGTLASNWGFPQSELRFYERALNAIQDEERSSERLKVYACLAKACLEQERFEESLEACRAGVGNGSLELATHDPEFIELCRVTQEVHFRRGDYVEALRFEERYLELARARLASFDTVESLSRLAFLSEKFHDSERAESYLLEAEPIARETGCRMLEAKVAERLGYLYGRQARWNLSFESLKQALTIYLELGEPDEVRPLFGATAIVCFFVGRVEEGSKLFREYALTRPSSSQSPEESAIPGFPIGYLNRSARDDQIRTIERKLTRHSDDANLVSKLADLKRDRGEFAASQSLLRSQLRRDDLNRIDMSRLSVQIGITYRVQGEFEPALESFQRGLDLLPDGRARELLAETNLQVSLLQLARGEMKRAVASVLRSLRTFLEEASEIGVARALLVLAECFLLLGKKAVSEELALSALSIAGGLDIDRLEAEAWLLLARIRLRSGKPGAGYEEVCASREIYTELGILEGRAQAVLVEAEILTNMADYRNARVRSLEALEIARDLGLQFCIPRALILKARLESDRRSANSRLPQAVRTLESVVEMARDLHLRPIAIEAHGALARLFKQRKCDGAAHEHLERARELTIELFELSPENCRKSLLRGGVIADLLRLFDLKPIALKRVRASGAKPPS